MKRRVLLAVLPAIALVVLAGAGDATSAAPGESQTKPGAPWAGERGVTVSVAELMARQRAADWGLAGQPGSGKDRTEPHEEPVEPHGPPKGPGSPTRQTRVGGAAIAPSSAVSAGTSFLGAKRLGDALFRPPDSMGAVGPTQVLVIVNGRVRVFDKDGTNTGVLDVTDSVFWNTVRDGLDVTDPQVEYDRLSQRWILSQINFDPHDLSMVDNRIMVAVSDGPTITPSTTWTYHFFTQNESDPQGAQALFADYPQMGVDANAIYIGTNDFGSSGGFAGTTAFVIRKSSAISAGPLVVTPFRGLVASSNGAGPFAPQPAQNMDPNVNEGYIVGVDNASFSRLDVRRISDPGGNPSISSNLVVNVPATVFPDRPSGCAAGNFCVPALGSSNGLDALDDRLYEAMIGRDESGTLSLWTAHNIEVNSNGVASTSGRRDGARWYQLGNLGGTPSLIQSGTLFDNASRNPRYFWIPSIAMNGQGHASLNASVAGSGRFAGIASSAHLASDPLGTTEPFDQLQSGVSYGNTEQGNAPSRWGDYSQTVVDPTDNQTFWTFQEYAFGNLDWGVRVIQLKAPPPATPSFASPTPIDPGEASQTVTITGTSTNGSGFFDPGDDPGGPGWEKHIGAILSGGVTVNDITYVDPTHVVLDLNTVGAPDGSKDVTITNPDGQAKTGQNILVVGSDTTPPDPPTLIGTDPASPANDNTPKILGAAEGGSAVRLYTNSACTGSPVGSGPAAELTSPGIQLSTPVPDNSTTTFYATATDISNNTSACSSTLVSGGSVTYVEDSTLPAAPTITGTAPVALDTAITKGPKKKTRKRRPKFSFTASESGATFLCKLDKQGFKPCGSPFQPPKKLKLGKHVLKVAAVDAAGNADPTPAVSKFKVLPPR
jgi:hypothetical protein